MSQRKKREREKESGRVDIMRKCLEKKGRRNSERASEQVKGEREGGDNEIEKGRRV